MKRLAIFDLDGTLLNTIDDLATTGNHLLRRYGWPEHPVESYKRFVGDGIYKLVERMIPADGERSEQMLLRLRDEFNEQYSIHNADLTAPYSGILDLLDRLREQGVLLAVLSNKPDAFTAKLCRDFMGERFAVVRGQREGYPTKPDRMLPLAVLRETGICAEDAIYIGDSGVDMQTAKNAGLFAVGVLWGFRTREELLENGADALAENPAAVLPFVMA